VIPPPTGLHTAASISSWFDKSLSSITYHISSNTPLKRSSLHSKSCSTPNLSQLWRVFHLTARAQKPGTATQPHTSATRNFYFKAIKAAKAKHWTQFLANVNAQSVWTTKKFAYGQAPDRFPSFPTATSPSQINSPLLNHFFPAQCPPTTSHILPTYPSTPLVSAAGAADALRKSANISAPGPDGIPYAIRKKVNKLNSFFLTSLLSPLLIHGHHPASLKRADGIVVSKPGKADYKSPASFRIIVFLETVSKILERIIASRLASLARNSGLLHPNQWHCSLANLGCLDAVSTISHEVRLLQSTTLKVPTMFLDIKGGFDNVNANQLSTILLRGKTPGYLVSWVRSFILQHCCRLIFQGSPGIFAPVAVGTPQGSPISPLLFVIYVSGLHLTIPKGLMVSYVDDFTITVASPSYCSNI